MDAIVRIAADDDGVSVNVDDEGLLTHLSKLLARPLRVLFKLNCLVLNLQLILDLDIFIIHIFNIQHRGKLYQVDINLSRLFFRSIDLSRPCKITNITYDD